MCKTTLLLLLLLLPNEVALLTFCCEKDRVVRSSDNDCCREIGTVGEQLSWSDHAARGELVVVHATLRLSDAFTIIMKSINCSADSPHEQRVVLGRI
jgi:hypothetical protein